MRIAPVALQSYTLLQPLMLEIAKTFVHTKSSKISIFNAFLEFPNSWLYQVLLKNLDSRIYLDSEILQLSYVFPVFLSLKIKRGLLWNGKSDWRKQIAIKIP